jgi:hypothetical protein
MGKEKYAVFTFYLGNMHWVFKSTHMTQLEARSAAERCLQDSSDLRYVKVVQILEEADVVDTPPVIPPKYLKWS